MKLQDVLAFQGPYRWLSNFAPCRVTWDQEYPSVEHAYQAAKFLDQDKRDAIKACETPGEAKKLAGTFGAMRKDWDQVKLRVMRYLLEQKFTPTSSFGRMLLATGVVQLVEGNTWGDQWWGVCGGEGQNHLGKMLMEIRTALRNGMFWEQEGGNLWADHENGWTVGVTTNCVLTRSETLVMGKGIAAQAKGKWPELPRDWAQVTPLSLVHHDTKRRLIRLPTKTEWKDRSEIAFVARTVSDLATLARCQPSLNIAVPPPGCGNGGLSWAEEVRPLFRQVKMPENVKVVLPLPINQGARRMLKVNTEVVSS